MISDIKKSLNLDKKTVININPLNLAFMGDAVWTMLVREYMCVNTNYKNNNLHKLTTKFVKATFQAQMIDFLDEVFVDEERDLIRRARNTKMNTVSKNASLADYKKATGFEAVIGYLYFVENFERINFLFDKIANNFFVEVKK